MSEKLKREFLELLEQDREFRYTVAGYIGLAEILKRLDKLEEGNNKIWEEIKRLREEQVKLWENQNRIWEEIKKLREGQEKLWEEVRSLRGGQNKLWENQNKLWENQNRLWEEVKALRESHNKLVREQERTRRYMIASFKDLSRALGVTFEEHAASFLEVMLIEMGYPEARVERKYLLFKNEIIEINMFCEEPLIVGEITLSVRSISEAQREIKKLIKRIKAVEKKYGRKPMLSVLSVVRSTPEATEALKTLAEKHNIRLILGREIREALQI